MPSTSTWQYSYFTGDVSKLENDIESFFNSQLFINDKKDSNYQSYFYEKFSLTNFISDEKLAEIGRLKSKIKLYDLKEKFIENTSISKIQEKIKNSGDFLSLGTVPEPFVDVNKNIEIDSPNLFQNYFRDVAGTYSISPLEIGNVEFVRNKVNDSFKGNNSYSSQNRIKLRDNKFPSEFWSMWKKLFRFNNFKTENLSTVKKYDSNYFPCKVTGKITFPEGALSKQTIIGFFLKDLLNIQIEFHGNNSKISYAPISKEFSMLTMLKESSRIINAPEIKVSNLEFFDRIHVYNPNKFSLFCLHVPCFWNNATGRLEYSTSTTMVIPPKTEDFVDMSSTVPHASRFYETIVSNGFYTNFLGENFKSFNYPTDQIPWKTISSKVPGIAGIIKPDLGDPAIGYYRLNDQTLVIRVSDIPSFANQLRFYIKQTSSTGAGAKRSPGINRQSYQYIGSKPEPGTQEIIPETLINYGSLSPGNYEIICDLYRGGSLIDTVNTIFTKDPQVAASNHGIGFKLTVMPSKNNSDLGSSLTIQEENESTSNDIANDLIENGTLPKPLNKPFDESFASSKKISRYLIERFNFGNCETEFIGIVRPNELIRANATEYTTAQHVYTARQFAATIGQLISTQSPIRISKKSGKNYYVDYAKFNSQHYLNFQTTPQVIYSLSSRDKQNWPFQALSQATTGRVKTSSISKSANVVPNINNLNVEFDSIRKVNIISWDVSWSNDSRDFSLIVYPMYWLITANYGGVTAPIAYQAAISQDLNFISVVDSTLGGSLGTVTYYINCVYPDGSVIKELAEESMVLKDDQYVNLTLGRGL